MKNLHLKCKECKETKVISTSCKLHGNEMEILEFNKLIQVIELQREALDCCNDHWFDPKDKENEGIACIYCDLKEASFDWRNKGHDPDCPAEQAKQALTKSKEILEGE